MVVACCSEQPSSSWLFLVVAGNPVSAVSTLNTTTANATTVAGVHPRAQQAEGRGVDVPVGGPGRRGRGGLTACPKKSGPPRRDATVSSHEGVSIPTLRRTGGGAVAGRSGTA